MLNHIVLMGRLVRDPELRHTASGVPVASFRIAVDRDFGNRETGEREADFIDVVAWRSTGEFVSKYFANEYMTKRWYLNHIYEDASVHWGITNGLEAILRQDSVFDTEKLKPLAGNRYIKTLAGRIQEVLPERPWNQSLSKSIALTLNVKSAAVNSAIRLMVEEGLFSLENGVQRDEPNTLF